jgi:EAL domain-containing protein (putative c-di-GMP-specific phosphodiesterase class I)
MRALAEGVETAEQLALAATLGCTFGQGYYIARPMPAAELRTWLRERPATGNLDPPAAAAKRLFEAP